MYIGYIKPDITLSYLYLYRIYRYPIHIYTGYIKPDITLSYLYRIYKAGYNVILFIFIQDI